MTHTIKRGMPRFWSVFLTAACGLLVPGMPLAFIADDGPTPVLVAIAVVTAIPWLWLLVRGARIRLVADERGLLVANYLRSRFVPWSEIERLQTGRGSMAWQVQDGRIELQIARKGVPGVDLVSATTTPSGELSRLVTDLAPIVELATAHGVPTEWKGLSEAELQLVNLIVARVGSATTAINRAL